MKKIILIPVIAFLIIAFIITKNKQPNTITLRFAYASNSGVLKDSMAYFGKILEEKSNNTIKVIYYPDAQLGTERELIELTQTGAIDFTKVSAGALESFSPSYAIFALPYLFSSEKHFFKVMESKIIEPIYNSTKELGFVGLTYYDSGQRSFYMKDRPINVPKDLNGAKIRVMQSETAIKMVKLMGGSPIPMSSSEVYPALSQGIIDGSENNEFVITFDRVGEVVKYYSYNEHTRVPDIVLVSNQTLKRLNPSQLDALYEAAKESTIYEKEHFKLAIEETKKQSIEEFGLIFNTVSNENKAKFRELVLPLHDNFKNHPTLSKTYADIMGMESSL